MTLPQFDPLWSQHSGAIEDVPCPGQKKAIKLKKSIFMHTPQDLLAFKVALPQQLTALIKNILSVNDDTRWKNKIVTEADVFLFLC